MCVMKKIILLVFFVGFYANAQSFNDAIYRKIALNSCRCSKGPDVFYVTLESIRVCDLLSIKSLSESERGELRFDESSEASYQRLNDNLLSYRKDYCPGVVKIIEDDKKEKAYQAELIAKREAKLLAEQNLAEEEIKLAEETKSAEQLRIAELERLLAESKKANGAESSEDPVKESRKERKAREKREKEEAEATNDNADIRTIELAKEVVVEVPKPAKAVFVDNVKNDSGYTKTVSEAIYDPTTNRLIKSSNVSSESAIKSVTEDRPTSSDEMTMIETFEELKSSLFNTIVIRDQSGQFVELMWLNKFVGSNLFTEGNVPVGTKVKAIYKDFEFYHGRGKEYRKFKIIRGFSIL